MTLQNSPTLLKMFHRSHWWNPWKSPTYIELFTMRHRRLKQNPLLTDYKWLKDCNRVCIEYIHHFLDNKLIIRHQICSTSTLKSAMPNKKCLILLQRKWKDRLSKSKGALRKHPNHSETIQRAREEKGIKEKTRMMQSSHELNLTLGFETWKHWGRYPKLGIASNGKGKETMKSSRQRRLKW